MMNEVTNVRRLSLSCYVRTCNSARLLDEVLTAAKDVASDLVVVDSGSKDDTLVIAARHGARIVHQPWLGWGHQKRVGEEACKHDWLLDLDSDEVLSQELIQEIQSVFANGGPDEDIYRLPLTMVDPTGRIWKNVGVSL